MDRVLFHDGVEIGWITAVGWEYVATDTAGVRVACSSYLGAISWLCVRWAKRSA